MAQARIEVPDSLLEKAAQAKIRALQRENKNLKARLDTAEKKLRDVDYTVKAAQRIQTGLREFTSILADELNLTDYEPYRRY